MEISKKELELFFDWLKDDGIKPNKSERLWKKAILKNLLNNETMTLDNYFDFLEDKKEKTKQTTSKSGIDTFDYTVLINKTLKTTNGKQIIKDYCIANSMIHLFFNGGDDLLVPKIDIQKSFSAKYEI